MLQYKNQDQRLKNEYNDLSGHNAHLKSLIEDLVKHIDQTLQKDITITMVGRTQTEQAEIYKDDEKYKLKPFKSPHQLWHALDIRSATFTKDEIAAIEKYLNDKYNGNNVYKWTAKCHEVANHGEHFHIQFFPRT